PQPPLRPAVPPPELPTRGSFLSFVRSSSPCASGHWLVTSCRPTPHGPAAPNPPSGKDVRPGRTSQTRRSNADAGTPRWCRGPGAGWRPAPGTAPTRRSPSRSCASSLRLGSNRTAADPSATAGQIPDAPLRTVIGGINLRQIQLLQDIQDEVG